MIAMSDDEDAELRRLRMKRMQSIYQKKQEQEIAAKRRSPTINDKFESLLGVLLQPNALQYLNAIKQRNIEVYQKIRSQIFPPQIMGEMDLLITYLQRGMIRRGIISLTEIQYLERQALGIESSITVKRQGKDATSLTSFLKDDD